DLVAARTDDHRGLRPLNERLGRGARRPELLLARHGDETAPVARARALGHRFIIAELQVVARGQNQILAVLILARTLVEREQRSRTDAFGVGDRLRGLELAAADFVDPHGRVLLSVGLLKVMSGVVVHFVWGRGERARARLLREQLDARTLEI